MMLRKIVYIIIIGMLCVTTNAQTKDNTQKKAEKARIANVKKEIDQAKTNLKQRKNLDKTESSMRNLLKDSLNMNDLRIHQLLKDAIIQQYAQLNEKAFLKQPYDTAQMFLLSQKLFLATEILDSIEALPNEKGISTTKNRKENAEVLSRFVNNLYSGIVYYVNKKKWNEATSIADLYLSLPQWTIFEGTMQLDTKRKIHASFLSLLSGYRGNNYPAALKYADTALLFERRMKSSLQYLSSISLSMNDTSNYVKYLSMGLEHYPTSNYFYSRLIDYYITENRLDDALDVTTAVLDADSLNSTALVTRQTIMLNLAKYDECIKIGEFILSMENQLFDQSSSNHEANAEESADESADNADKKGRNHQGDKQALAEVNYNMALAYYNQSLEIEKNIKNTRQRNNALKPLYKKCRPYMERYRQLAPEEKERWKPVLYTIYLNLNLGKEFAEIENL